MMPTKSSTAKVKVVKLTQKAGEAASGAGSKSVLTVGSSQVGYWTRQKEREEEKKRQLQLLQPALPKHPDLKTLLPRS